MNTKTIILTSMFLFYVGNCFSQPKVSVETTIKYLNGKLDGSEEFLLKGKKLTVFGFKNGFQSKEDNVNIYDLDPTRVFFSEDEMTVSIRCYKDLDDCIARQALQVKKRSYKKRIAFEVKSVEDGKKIAKALTHLISCFADNKYVGPSSLE